MLPTRHWAYPWIAVAAALLMLLRSASTMLVFNHTFDEPYHIGAALGLYETGKHVVDITHPPLPWLVAGLPLVLSGVELPEIRGLKRPVNLEGSERIGARALFDQKLPYWSVLTRARAAMLLFPLIALFYLYRLGRWLVNSLVAMLSVALFSTDPALLGHSPLINNDVAACAGYLAALYYGARWIARPSLRGALLAGAVFGLAVASKFTAVLILPTLILILLWRSAGRFCRRWRSRSRHAARGSPRYVSPWNLLWGLRRRWPSIVQLAVFAVAACFMLFAAYLFNIDPLGEQEFFTYTRKLDELPAFVRQTPIPMPSFVLGLAYQSVHNAKGHPTYLNGHFSRHGWWYYFPEALAVKETVAFLGGFLLAGIGWFVRRPSRPGRAAFLLLPTALYLAVAMSGNLMIGIRYLLPVLPLLCLFICWELAGRRALVPIVVILVALVETSAQHPDYIAFFNLAAGGPGRGDRYLLDSNLDWGQDIARLARWLESDPARAREYTTRVYNVGAETTLAAVGLNPSAQRQPPRGLFAISKSLRIGLGGMRIGPDGALISGQSYAWLRRYPLVETVGRSIEVYDLGPSPATQESTSPDDMR